MEIEKIYSALDGDGNIPEKRKAAINYLQECVDNLPNDPGERLKVAYKIAGLMSTNFALSLEDNDDIDQILTLAGELEVPSVQDNSASWDNFVSMVCQLDK